MTCAWFSQITEVLWTPARELGLQLHRNHQEVSGGFRVLDTTSPTAFNPHSVVLGLRWGKGQVSDYQRKPNG